MNKDNNTKDINYYRSLQVKAIVSGIIIFIFVLIAYLLNNKYLHIDDNNSLMILLGIIVLIIMFLFESIFYYSQIRIKYLKKQQDTK